jgi:hypothetical protein
VLQRQFFFERNDGQTDKQVLYVSHGLGYSLFLTRTGATIVLPPQRKGTAAGKGDADYFRLRFAGANPRPEVAGIEELPGKSNYFFGSDPKLWRTHIPHFAKVRYANLCPGIDVIFYSRDGKLEYDIVGAPGASVEAIRLKVERAHASLSRNGEVALRSGKNELIQMKKPYAYQPGGMATVTYASYSVQGDELSFALSGYEL